MESYMYIHRWWRVLNVFVEMSLCPSCNSSCFPNSFTCDEDSPQWLYTPHYCWYSSIPFKQMHLLGLMFCLSELLLLSLNLSYFMKQGCVFFNLNGKMFWMFHVVHTSYNSTNTDDKWQCHGKGWIVEMGWKDLAVPYLFSIFLFLGCLQPPALSKT